VQGQEKRGVLTPEERVLSGLSSDWMVLLTFVEGGFSFFSLLIQILISYRRTLPDIT
jgi:hypothetical protein